MVWILEDCFLNKICFLCIKEIILKNNCESESGREEKKWDVANEKPLLFIHAHISSLFMFWFHQSPGTSIIDEADLKVTTGYVFTSVYFLQPNTEICIFTTIHSFNKSSLCWAATSTERAPWRVDLFQSFVWIQLQSWEFDWLTGAEEIWGQCSVVQAIWTFTLQFSCTTHCGSRIAQWEVAGGGQKSKYLNFAHF